MHQTDTPETADRLEILQAPPNERFDRLVRTAASTFGCACAAITLIDGDQVRFKAIAGTIAEKVPRELSYTSLIVESDESFVVEDTASDPRTCRHPAAAHRPSIRFLAAQPIRAPDGRRIGAMAVWDSKPRQVGAEQIALLGDLAAQTEWELYRWELLEAKRRLQESERLYRALFEPSPDAVYVIDPHGRFTSVNGAVTKLTGYAHEELLGQSFASLISPEDLPRTLECFHRCLAGETQYLEVQHTRKDGRRVHVSISAAPYIVNGTIRGIAGITRDVTERVVAEQRLKDSEERLNLALDGSGQLVWDWDVEADRLLVSSHAVAVLGYRPDELATDSRHWQSLVHPEDAKRTLDQLRAALRNGRGAHECEYRLRCKDGSYKWVLNRGKITSYASDGRPRRIIGTLTDIHARKEAEAERVRQSERMALAVRAGGVGIFELDLAAGSCVWDGRMYELFGWPRAGAAPTLDQMAELVHPDDRQRVTQLLRRLRDGASTTIDTEFRVPLADGRVRELRCLGKVLDLADGAERLLIGTCWDVSDGRQLQRQLVHQASHDALTGLANRFEFERHLQLAVTRAQKAGRQHCVCFIDLDRFKLVNDSAGHAAGDVLLREVGQRLAHEVRTSDLLARLGGDEFGLLLTDCTPEQAESVAAKLIESIEAFQFQWDGRLYELSASVGIASIGRGAAQVGEIMSQADIACYAAKTAKRPRISIYRPERSDAQQYHRELLLAAGIREALEADRFTLHAQQIIATASAGSTRHYELLVRMRDPQGHLIPPGAFIPAAERYDLMSHIDRWVLREALVRQAERLAAIPHLVIAINLSAQSLNDPGFADFVEELLSTSPLPAERVILEITETAAVTHLAAASNVIGRLRDMGCSVALDDFGSGLSSFNYLKHFPVDYVKIDGSFIKSLGKSAGDRTIVESIHEIARKLGPRTIAEYVEDDTILDIVREVGIDYAQGYGIARPLPLTDVLGELTAGFGAAAANPA